MPPQLITSLQNQRVKDAAKLRDRRQREKQGRFLVDGVRELDRALDAGLLPADVFVCPALYGGDATRQLAAKLDHTCGDVVSEVTPEVFEKLAYGERLEGIVAAVPTPTKPIEALELAANALVCVLERVEKPGNVGAILRSADAAGVAAVIVADERTDLFNPNAVRASLGTVFTVPIATADAAATLAWLRERRYAMWAARVGAGPLYTEVNYHGPTAIILGSEAEGLSARWWSEDIKPIHLPMLGRADSLNVSVAAAIMFYEALRQRRLNT